MTQPPPSQPAEAYLVLVDVLLEKPVAWRLRKKHLTVGIESMCDIVLPRYEIPGLVEDRRNLSHFALHYDDETGVWLVQRRFDQVKFHPAIEKRWFRASSEAANDACGAAVAPEGLVMCMLNPDSSAVLEHGDSFEFTPCVSVPRFNMRFSFLTALRTESDEASSETPEDDSVSEEAAEKKRPVVTFEALPDLVLANIASFLGPSEFLNSLHVACPWLTDRVRGRIQLPNMHLDDSLDTARVADLVSPSSIVSVTCEHSLSSISKEDCPAEFFNCIEEFLTSETVTELRIRQLGIFTQTSTMPKKLTKVRFLNAANAGRSWSKHFGEVTFPATVNSVSYACEYSDSPAFHLKSLLFSAFPNATRFGFFPSPSAEFWDDIDDDTLCRITHFHAELALRSEFPIDRMDNLKVLKVCILDPYALLSDVFYFTFLPSLESLSVNLMALGQQGKENFWISLPERAPVLKHLEICSLNGEFRIAGKLNFAVCDDTLIDVLIKYWPPHVSCLILRDCFVSVNALVRLIRSVDRLSYCAVRSKTNYSPLPPVIRVRGDRELRFYEQESVKFDWEIANGSDDHVPVLDFVFSVLPGDEMFHLRKLFEF